MSFPARFPGICVNCSGKISTGDQITWSRKERGKVYHATCPTIPNAVIVDEVPIIKRAGVIESIPEPIIDHAPTRSLRQNFCEFCKMSFNSTQKIKTLGDDGKGNYIPYHDYCLDTYLKELKTKVAIPNSITENKTMSNTNNPLDVFAQALAPMVQDRLKSTLDENAVKKIVDQALSDAGMVKPLEIKNLDTGDITKIDSPHKDLKKLLYFISKRQHVYLHGPAGSGKSTAAMHVSQALKLEFGYISLNPQTPDSRILGFVDAGGTYRETAFYKTYKNGGVFCIDEMDNASASLLTTLNSMLENGHGAFPNGIIPRHKDFVLVATGNTNGRGGNPMFPERRPFDAAFAERFTFLFWDYDGELEKAVALSINPNAKNWINYTKKLRDYCAKTYPRVLISPRATFKGAEYLKDSQMTPAEIAEAVIFKGLDRETITRIAGAVPYPEFATAGK